MEVNWPPLLLGLILAAYWARVLRLVYKARRRTGRHGNFLPPEPLGRFLRLVWYPAVGIWVLHPLVSAFLASPPPLLRMFYASAVVSWLALLVAAGAFLATLVCWRRMGKSWRMGIDPSEKTQLILSGPYEYVRHPIYALSSVLMLATLAIVPTWLMLATAAFHLFLLQWEARREERYLVTVHGQAYADYMRQVGRFVPLPSRRRVNAL